MDTRLRRRLASRGCAVALGGALPAVSLAAVGPVGTEFQVNTYTSGDQQAPDVAVRPDGSFVVVWDSEGSFGSDSARESVQVRLLDADGGFLGSQFQVNELTAFFQYEAAVAARPDGSFVVAWHSYVQLRRGSRFEVAARELDAALSPTTPDLAISGAHTSVAGAPAVAAQGPGRYVVVWQERAGRPLRAQRMASGGITLGAPFEVSTPPPSVYSLNTRVGLEPGPRRELLATWHCGSRFVSDESPDGDDYAVMGRFLGRDEPLGEEFVVNAYTPGEQVRPAAAFGKDGRALVVWQSRGGDGTDTDGYSIQARFVRNGDVFTDGFESGGLDGWSAVWPEPRR